VNAREYVNWTSQGIAITIANVIASCTAGLTAGLTPTIIQRSFALVTLTLSSQSSLNSFLLSLFAHNYIFPMVYIDWSCTLRSKQNSGTCSATRTHSSSNSTLFIILLLIIIIIIIIINHNACGITEHSPFLAHLPKPPSRK
jgi:hypothetical protein